MDTARARTRHCSRRETLDNNPLLDGGQITIESHGEDGGPQVEDGGVVRGAGFTHTILPRCRCA